MIAAQPPQGGLGVAAIVRAAVIDGLLIAAGVAAYISTGQIIWPLVAMAAGAGVMVSTVVVPLVRARVAAQKASDGGPRIVE